MGGNTPHTQPPPHTLTNASATSHGARVEVERRLWRVYGGVRPARKKECGREGRRDTVVEVGNPPLDVAAGGRRLHGQRHACGKGSGKEEGCRGFLPPPALDSTTSPSEGGICTSDFF